MSNDEKASAEAYGFWFGKPVAIQLREPYIMCADSGAAEVSVTDQDGNEQKRLYGKPQVIIQQVSDGQRRQSQPIVMKVLEGEMQPDPAHPGKLVVEMQPEINMEGVANPQLVIGLDPSNIDFITQIPEHQEQSKIVSPPTKKVIV